MEKVYTLNKINAEKNLTKHRIEVTDKNRKLRATFSKIHLFRERKNFLNTLPFVNRNSFLNSKITCCNFYDNFEWVLCWALTLLFSILKCSHYIRALSEILDSLITIVERDFERTQKVRFNFSFPITHTLLW